MITEALISKSYMQLTVKFGALHQATKAELSTAERLLKEAARHSSYSDSDRRELKEEIEKLKNAGDLENNIIKELGHMRSKNAKVLKEAASKALDYIEQYIKFHGSLHPKQIASLLRLE